MGDVQQYTVQFLAREVLTVLSGPERWTQEAFARQENGASTGYRSSNAVCWCLGGAVLKIVASQRSAFADAVISLARKVVAITGQSTIEWNDDPERTFEDVRKFLEFVATGKL